MKKRFLMAAALLLSSCAREAWRAPMAPDTTTLLLPAAPAGKWKFNGPVNITLQQGNGNVATPTAAGKTKADAVAIGPAAASATKPNGTPWWALGLLAAVGLGLGFWVRSRL